MHVAIVRYKFTVENFQKIFCRSLNCYASGYLIALIPNYTYI